MTFLPRLINLKKLWISRMYHLSIVKKNAFRSSSLKELTFTYNGYHFESELFKHLPSLKKIQLINNDLSQSHFPLWRLFYRLSNLTELNLQESRVKVLSERLFKNMPFLEILNLKNNRIVTWSQNVFENLTSLRRLFLDGNHIRVINESSFPIKLLWTLSKLDLSHNEF